MIELLEKMLLLNEDEAGIRALYKIYHGIERGIDPEKSDVFTALDMMREYYIEYKHWYQKVLRRSDFKRYQKEMPVIQAYLKRLAEINAALVSGDEKEMLVALDSAVNQWHIDFPAIHHIGMEIEDDLELERILGNIEEILSRLGRLPEESPYKGLGESSIDFPQEDLDSSVWIKKEDGSYTPQLDIRDKIENLIRNYQDKDLLSIAEEIHIVGSIASNQYLDDCDIDIHIIPKNIKDWSEEEVEEVTNWFNKHRDEMDGFIGSHPVEIYIQVEPSQDLMSDGCYDLLNDRWLTGPKIVPMDLDPYEDYSHILDDVKDAVEDADLLLGELKRDVIDYEVIKQAMKRMAGENKEKLLKKLQDKLSEMEDDIEALYKERGEWVDKRRKASKPATPEEALEDVKLAKRWKDTNALFKFVNRYHYLRVIKDLKELLADDEITPDEVSKIKNIMGM